MANILIAKKVAKNAAQHVKLVNPPLNVLLVLKPDMLPILKELVHQFAEMELLSLDKVVIQVVYHLPVVLDAKFNQIGYVLGNHQFADQLFQFHQLHQVTLPQLLHLLLTQIHWFKLETQVLIQTMSL
jgi:hypothetical protein